MAESPTIRPAARDDLPRVLELFDVLGDRPAYAPPATAPERYLEALVTDRARAGEGIGTWLIEDAIALTRAAGVPRLSSDCWAGAPRLVRRYEQQGFARGATFAVGDWPGQQLELEVSP